MIQSKSVIGNIKLTTLVLEFVILAICYLFLNIFINNSKEQGFKAQSYQDTEILNKYSASRVRLTDQIRVVNKYLSGSIDENSLKAIYSNLNTNLYGISSSFSVGENPYFPKLPIYIENILQKQPIITVNKIIIHGNKVSILNKKEINGASIVSVYNIMDDFILKKNIESSNAIGFSFVIDNHSYGWIKNSEVSKSLNLKDISEYKLTSSPKHIFIKNRAGFENFYFVISDKFVVNSKRQFMFFVALLFLVKFIITLFANIAALGVFKKHINILIQNTKNMASNILDKKIRSVEYPFIEFQSINNAFLDVLTTRDGIEGQLINSRDKMENKVEQRTRDLSIALDRAEKAGIEKMDFLAYVSHEIRTPMNCIIGFCELIIHEHNIDLYHKYAERIINESETLLHLINDVLDHSKIESGKMVVEEGNLNLENFIQSIVALGNPYGHCQNVIIDYYISKKLPPVIGVDEIKLYQIVSNLYFNSLKYTQDGSVIINIDLEKDLGKDGLLIIIDVVDTGIGIPSERIEYVFDSYNQLKSKLTKQFRGTGLGLTITQELVEVLGGTISVKSELGVGSCFTVNIPVSRAFSEDSLSMPNENIKKISGQSGEILLVEDYLTNRIIVVKHLVSAGYSVTEVSNGFEAVNICRKKQFDLILMDVQMPIMDGLTATKKIRNEVSLNSETPIFAMTANALDSVKDECYTAGMSGIMIKPIRRDSLIQSVYTELNKVSSFA